MNDTKSFIYIKQMYMKGFFSLEDRCKEKISLEDYWDFIISPYREGELEGVDTEENIGTVRSQNAIHFWICSR